MTKQPKDFTQAEAEKDEAVDQCLEELITDGDGPLAVVLSDILYTLRNTRDKVNALGMVFTTIHRQELQDLLKGQTETRKDEGSHHGIYL